MEKTPTAFASPADFPKTKSVQKGAFFRTFLRSEDDKSGWLIITQRVENPYPWKRGYTETMSRALWQDLSVMDGWGFSSPSTEIVLSRKDIPRWAPCHSRPVHEAAVAEFRKQLAEGKVPKYEVERSAKKPAVQEVQLAA